VLSISSYAADIDILMQSGRYEEAYQALLGDLNNNPGDKNTLYLLGLTAPNGNRSSLFLKEYMQKFGESDKMDAVRRRLLDYYQAAGLHITAGRLYEDDGSIKSANAQDLYRVGVINQQLGNYKLAAEYYNDAISRSDGDIADWCRLGLADCELLNEDYKAAERAYKNLIEKHPDSPSIPFCLIGLSETYRRMGQMDKSATYYELYSEKYESSPGSEEIEAAILDKEPSKISNNLSNLIDVDYYIQVGIFAKKDNAKRCVRRFRNLGYRSKLERFSQNGKAFYKALIGPYTDEKMARSEKSSLEKSQGEEYLIVLQ